MNNKGYEYVESLVSIFFEGDELEKTEALSEIIECFKPLIINIMMRYFKIYDEDIMQDAIVELIERTLNYDYKNYNKFVGYIKRFMELYFRRIYFAHVSVNETSYNDSYIVNISCEDSYDVELDSMMSMLDDKQRYLIEHNVIMDKKLMSVAKDMQISYVYAKKLKKSAIDTMKNSIVV